MSFKSGSVSFRVFHLPRPLPEDVLAGLQQRVAPAQEYVKDQPVYGWVTSRHLLDRQITEETAWVSDLLSVTLLQQERRIPSAILRAEVKQEELAYMQVYGENSISRRQRAEITQEVRDRLLHKMPVSMKGMEILAVRGGQLIFAEAMNEKQLDVLCSYLRDAMGFMPEVLAPVASAFNSAGLDVRDLPPTSYARDVDALRVSDNVGCDFLTWLWYRADVSPDNICSDAGHVGLLVEGPIRMIMEGGGAHEITLRKGNPMVSSEVKTCLECGKKLARARLSLVKGENVWSFTFDAETFAIRAMKIPQADMALDWVSRFQERAQLIQEAHDTLMKLYLAFLRLRTDSTRWNDVTASMRDWVDNRNVVY